MGKAEVLKKHIDKKNDRSISVLNLKEDSACGEGPKCQFAGWSLLVRQTLPAGDRHLIPYEDGLNSDYK